MKQRIILFSLIAMLLMPLDSGGLMCQYMPPYIPDRPIRVGIVRDFDEDLSFFECNGAGPVYRWFVNKVNAEGGLHLKFYDTETKECRVPLELYVRDFNLEQWDISYVTRDVIDYGCHSVWGGPHADCIYAQGAVCTQQRVLLMTLEGDASFMIWDHERYLDVWPWVFINQSFSSWYQLPVLHEILYQKLGRAPKLYITYVDDDEGIEYLAESEMVFGEENIVAAVMHEWRIDMSSADSIIRDAAAALNVTPYDLFCGWTYPWNVEKLTQACIDNKFNPPGIIFGAGANFGRFGAPPPDGFGPANVEGIMCFAVANNKTVVRQGTPTMSMADMYDAIASQIESDWTNAELPCSSGNLTSGKQALDYWGTPCYVAALEMWKAAVESCEDPYSYYGNAIRNPLAAFSRENPAQTVFGDTWYTMFGEGAGGGVLAYQCHTGEIGQWQNGTIEIVGYDGITDDLPNYYVTANLVYPMTGRWGWLQ